MSAGRIQRKLLIVKRRVPPHLVYIGFVTRVQCECVGSMCECLLQIANLGIWRFFLYFYKITKPNPHANLSSKFDWTPFDLICSLIQHTLKRKLGIKTVHYLDYLFTLAASMCVSPYNALPYLVDRIFSFIIITTISYHYLDYHCLALSSLSLLSPAASMCVSPSNPS